MRKILLLTQYDDDGTYFYRLKPLFHLNHIEISVERKPYLGEINYSFFDGYDVLIMERPSGIHDLNCIKLAKQCGIKVITDWDDDVLHVDSYNPMWHHYEQCKAMVMEAIVLSSEVWVSTNGVKQSFRLLNDNIHVVPNCHNDYLMPVNNRLPFNSNNKRAIWRGGSSHEADVYNQADGIIKTINDNSNWQFQFIGHRFIYLEQRCGDNYIPVSLMPILQYFDFIYNQNPNLVLHPLSNTKFNESKSHISWMEATYVGAAFIGNKLLPEFGNMAQLSMDFFSEVLSENLMRPSDLSWEYICDTLLLSVVNKKREERLLSL